jgi:ribosomal protein S18 acetylase RimI-like enzyme
VAVTLRHATGADDELMLRVYGSTRAEEMAIVPWTEVEKAAFLRMQSDAQRAHYTQVYPDADWLVIEEDGAAIGRLIVDRTRGEIRLMDIALLPESRGRGIGTSLVRGLMAEAERSAMPLRLHVETFNPARDLYRRLGFTEVLERGILVQMVWPAEAKSGEAA